MKSFLTAGLLLPAAALAQTPTVGTLAFLPDSVSPGYTLYQPHNQPDAFLINFCGEVVHRWEAADSLRPGNSAYLLPNGDLVRAVRPAVTSGDAIWAGGGGATIERITWDGDPVWSFTLNTATERLHHDFVPIPGGNVLALVWEKVDSVAAVAAGRLPETVGASGLWPEKIIELQPDGAGGATVVWEWRAWDHLVQTTSTDLPHFGSPADFPERIDVNFGTPETVPADWLHANSIDYHPQLGHILVSIPTFDEVWIIDHAAPESGLVWRWGNPAAYGAGTADDRQLHYQHSAHWIDGLGLQPDAPDFGKIGVFDNQNTSDLGPYSTAHILAPVFADGLYQPGTTGTFGPDAPDWTWAPPNPTAFYSSGLSNFQRLPNGNNLITLGRTGMTYEFTPAGSLAWHYRLPLNNGVPVAQGTQLTTNANLFFRATRYPAQFPAFANVDLSAGEVIELDPTPLPACLPCTLELVLVSNETGLAEVAATGGIGDVELVWLNADGIPVATGAVLADLPAGLYTVTAVDANGCAAALEVDYFNTGIAALAGPSRPRWTLYPNPATDHLTLAPSPTPTPSPSSISSSTSTSTSTSTSPPTPISISISSSTSTPTSTSISISISSSTPISTSHLPSGWYFLTVTDAYGRQTLPFCIVR